MSFRIVRFVIDSESWESLFEFRELVKSLQRACEWGPWGDNIKSERMTTLSKQFTLVSEMLHSHMIKHEILDISDDYELWVTNAPAAYDYTAYNFEIATLPDGERLMALDKTRSESYQVPRYQSGLYSVRKVK